MTSDDLWREVGRHLRDRREGRGKKWWVGGDEKPPIDTKTRRAIEHGTPGTLDKLETYAQAMEMSIVDVVSAVLKDAEHRLSPEAATLLRCFEHLTVWDRRLVLEKRG
jgi:hypothetical protein